MLRGLSVTVVVILALIVSLASLIQLGRFPVSPTEGEAVWIPEQSPLLLEVLPDGPIQAALDEAPEGSVVLVHPGRYRGHLTLEKPLTLKALSGAVLEGDDPRKATIEIRAPEVTVEGFTVLGGKVGIAAAGGCRILGNTLVQAEGGLELADGCLIEGNTFMGNDVGLRGYAVHDATVRSNRFVDNGTGIELSDFYAREGRSHRVMIEGNRIRGGERGIVLSWVHDNVLRANRVEGHKLQGILLYGGHGNRVEGNLLEDNGTGLSLWKGEGNVISDNSIYRNRGDGLLIYDMASNRIEGNEVEGNGRIGIHLLNTRGLEVRGNRVRLNRYGGIVEQLASRNRVEDNTEAANGRPRPLPTYPEPWREPRGKLAFVRGEGDAQEIFVLSFEEGGVREARITENDVWDGSPVWSPDGSRLAFVRHPEELVDEVWLYDLDAQDQKRLLCKRYDADLPPMGLVDIRKLQWAPDGSALYFLSSYWATNDALWQLQLDGSSRLITGSLELQVLQDGSLLITERSYLRGGVSGESYRIRVRGGTEWGWAFEHHLEEHDCTELVLSPDGRWGACLVGLYPQSRPAWERGFYLLDEETGQIVRLGDLEMATFAVPGDPIRGFEAVFSPDGRNLVYVSDRDGDRELYLLDLATGEERKLTDNDAEDYDPAWSPDGSWVAFVSERDGNSEIYIIRPHGTEERRLTHDPAPDRNPAWGQGEE